DVASALACHVIGPLSPTTCRLTASLRPARVVLKNGSATGSLHTISPGGTVTLVLPLKFTGWFVPATTAPPLHCSPAYTPSKVTGFVPKTFEKRRRVCRLQ